VPVSSARLTLIVDNPRLLIGGRDVLGCGAQTAVNSPSSVHDTSRVPDWTSLLHCTYSAKVFCVYMNRWHIAAKLGAVELENLVRRLAPISLLFFIKWRRVPEKEETVDTTK
jgi:hypothetical protein